MELLNCPHCNKKPVLQLSQDRVNHRQQAQELYNRASSSKPLSTQKRLEMLTKANKLLLENKKEKAKPFLDAVELSDLSSRKGLEKLSQDLKVLEKDAWEVRCDCNPNCFVIVSVDERGEEFSKEQACVTWNTAVKILDTNDNSKGTPKDCCKKAEPKRSPDGMVLIKCNVCKLRWMPLK